MEVFTKPALSALALLDHLEKNGLEIGDEDRAIRAIRTIGYYRFSAYLRPFRVMRPDGKLGLFRPGTLFSDGLALYDADRQLRDMTLAAVGPVEIALKGAITDIMSAHDGPHWFLNPDVFTRHERHDEFLSKVRRVVVGHRSHHVFLRHYHDRYGEPDLPPSWMVLEILEFGAVSTLYNHLGSVYRKEIAARFGIPHRVLGSWIHVASHLRNICAHHGRVWNRVFRVIPKVLHTYEPALRKNDRFHAQAIVVKVLLDSLGGGEDWTSGLVSFLERHPSIDCRAMGFPPDWHDLAPWCGTPS